MTITLELPPELECELAADAARLRLPLAEYALRVLAMGRTSSTAPRTGAELLAYWQKEGLVGTRTDIANVPEHARGLRQRAESRKRS
jgi:hypothetical protein